MAVRTTNLCYEYYSRPNSQHTTKIIIFMAILLCFWWLELGYRVKLSTSQLWPLAIPYHIPEFDCGGLWVGEEVTFLARAGSRVGEGEKGLSEMVGDKPARRWQNMNLWYKQHEKLTHFCICVSLLTGRWRRLLGHWSKKSSNTLHVKLQCNSEPQTHW